MFMLQFAGLRRPRQTTNAFASCSTRETGLRTRLRSAHAPCHSTATNPRCWRRSALGVAVDTRTTVRQLYDGIDLGKFSCPDLNAPGIVVLAFFPGQCPGSERLLGNPISARCRNGHPPRFMPDEFVSPARAIRCAVVADVNRVFVARSSGRNGTRQVSALPHPAMARPTAVKDWPSLLRTLSRQLDTAWRLGRRDRRPSAPAAQFLLLTTP